MSYCIQCGQPLLKNPKFCPSCGTKTTQLSSDTNQQEGYAQKMYKNAVQSLNQHGKTQLEQQVRQQVGSMFPKTSTLNQSTQPINKVFRPSSTAQQVENTNQTQSGIDAWSWVYLALNAILIYLGFRSDEVLGVIIFSFVIMTIVWWRRSKPKPYNWLVKIILGFQSVLLFAFVAEQIEYFGIITLLMVLLFFVDLRLIFKGNKHQ